METRIQFAPPKDGDPLSSWLFAIPETCFPTPWINARVEFWRAEWLFGLIHRQRYPAESEVIRFEHIPHPVEYAMYYSA
jgi:hypothetical protein